ncbi:GntR family transcriptional regulator [Pollutimonas bauzanensis]|uniref:GntR family transcriptional regulator n=1 Tax=Pollutimonas bauzanensis TaxID=658167 RepID=UPI0033400063
MQTLLTVAPRPETLSANVLFQIKDLLITGRLVPGEQLSLRSTAEALGVSVMPVRDAVSQLVAEQALEVAPNRSVRVPKLNAQQFTELTQIRLQIEGYAAEQAARNAPTSLIPQLRSLNTQLAEEMGAADHNKSSMVLLNKELHFRIYQSAGMPMLLKIIESLWLKSGPILNYDLLAGSQRTSKKIAVAHHEKLINALEARQPAAAKKALHDDINSAFKYILRKQFREAGIQ